MEYDPNHRLAVGRGSSRDKEGTMKRAFFVVLLSLFALGSSIAQPGTCEQA
jgi:hypothetical protein